MIEALAISLPSQVQDLTKKRYGKLTVVSFSAVVNGNAKWNCRCDCGAERSVFACDLKSGNSKSCGCSKSINRPGRFDYASLALPTGANLASDRERDPEFTSYVLELFSYCPLTGNITSKKTGRSRLCKTSRGYKTTNVRFKKVAYKLQAHRAAWLLYYKQWPKSSIDHINGVKHDNRIENLRESYGSSRNVANTGIRLDNKTGFKGVLRRETNKFNAQIRVNHRTIYLGMFDTKEEAALAYNNAATHYFGEFAKLNVVPGKP